MCLAALMFGLEISSVPVILPTLEVALHGNFSGIQRIMNAYIRCSTSRYSGCAISRARCLAQWA
uniref:Uncharacterized protein n=1 Tax=Ralstonia solanacearum TaxID=305 RepID=A0A0S4TMR6_RALSL|nr:protein of unknown function [Ralstonia solanacearum]